MSFMLTQHWDKEGIREVRKLGMSIFFTPVHSRPTALKMWSSVLVTDVRAFHAAGDPTFDYCKAEAKTRPEHSQKWILSFKKDRRA